MDGLLNAIGIALRAIGTFAIEGLRVGPVNGRSTGVIQDQS